MIAVATGPIGDTGFTGATGVPGPTGVLVSNNFLSTEEIPLDFFLSSALFPQW